jgi:hypothetical protein
MGGPQAHANSQLQNQQLTHQVVSRPEAIHLVV